MRHRPGRRGNLRAGWTGSNYRPENGRKHYAEIVIFLPLVLLPNSLRIFLQIGACQGFGSGLFSVLLFRDNLLRLADEI
jgi:hypothetical protein